ncbi:hypothetical protein GE21DRAFT_6950 [Neurospora crassa]|uniref:Uncharacterized protein n=1 Tax=Neurospora crassa (strain ATCC 24698 / 74-OR23-1A / CBS 708.71 / DSM 1257 / FGSC 987) TaxID=367110 RepID=Q7S252_NEUCR|nr:hypothetical protein NCU08916 [Neurospora crassa OR74A]EAA29449.2 hypothetical protein NCU08916 [Neurospora crassa OR74A]KHE83884.1 hypothetical protein GE21DRAFT_6950 [Neurospora crassa]|eukprot:XP_958685.2 hypothetical protein NCU08916 [Neurospora crassa OR74A]
MLIHCISSRPSHIFPALLLLLLIYWLCLWVKMDQSLRLAGTPARVIIGGGVAGDAAGNGTNCIAAAVATTQPDTTADVPAEISGVGAVAVAVAAEKPDKAEKTEEKTEEAGDKKKQKKEKKEEAAEKKVVAKDVEAWWKQIFRLQLSLQLGPHLLQLARLDRPGPATITKTTPPYRDTQTRSLAHRILALPGHLRLPSVAAAAVL